MSIDCFISSFLYIYKIQFNYFCYMNIWEFATVLQSVYIEENIYFPILGSVSTSTNIYCTTRVLEEKQKISRI